MKLTLVLIFLFASTAGAKEPIKIWKGGKGYSVKARHLAMPLTDEEFYTDRYTAEAWFEDGTRAYVSFLVSNLGAGTGKLRVKSRWTDKAGKNHRFKKHLKQGEYKAKDKPFSVTAAGHRLWGTPKRFKVKAHSDGKKYQLTFESGLPPWRPGTGRTTFGVDESLYYDTTLVQPKAVVTGTVNGKKIKGYGYVQHTHANIAPHMMFKKLMSFRSIDSDTVFWMQSFKTPKRYGGKTVSYLYVARGGKVIVATGRVRIKAAKAIKDHKHPRKYAVPMRIHTLAVRGVHSANVLIRATKIKSREDMLKKKNAWEAALIRQFAQPVEYSLEATVEITVNSVVSTEPTTYNMTHLNK